ncbi:hypothetical protein [Nocardioides sp. SYSU D00038]|uniref:hypothetical protein n=1 Tax=Nocardioides sp. SYSU D00038 TaxID=2812554 RepID=UPI001967FC97|nr:hypothetical protein [Nocardioides sp. SYSU D00038]
MMVDGLEVPLVVELTRQFAITVDRAIRPGDQINLSALLDENDLHRDVLLSRDDLVQTAWELFLDTSRTADLRELMLGPYRLLQYRLLRDLYDRYKSRLPKKDSDPASAPHLSLDALLDAENGGGTASFLEHTGQVGGLAQATVTSSPGRHRSEGGTYSAERVRDLLPLLDDHVFVWVQNGREPSGPALDIRTAWSRADLSHGERQAAYLVGVLDLTHREAGTLLGVNHATVGRRFAIACEKLATQANDLRPRSEVACCVVELRRRQDVEPHLAAAA